MDNSQKGKYSIKCINGKFYVYTWSYVPKRFRKKRKQDKRYSWKYIGVYGGAKASEYFSSLSLEEQEFIDKIYRQRVHAYKVMEEIRGTIEETEPFKTQKNNIMKINNRYQRTKQLRALNKEIKDLVHKNKTV